MDPVRYLKALWRDPSVRAGLALSLGMTIKAWAVARRVCLAVGNLVVVRQVWLVRPAWEEQRPAVRHPGDLRREQLADLVR